MPLPLKRAENLKLSGKVLAAIVSPSFENVPARLGSHALSEAVNLASLSFLGLIGPFHFILLNLRRVFFFCARP